MVNKEHISFRIATIKDSQLLKHWDNQQHVIDSDPDQGWNWDYELRRFPKWREQLIVEVNRKPIGCIQIIDPAREETHYWGAIQKNLRAIDIWIGEKDYLGKGYGTIMMTMAMERCFKNTSITAILIDPLESNVKAIRFYKRLGFQFIEKRNFEESKCEVYKLSRKNWKDQIQRFKK